MKTRIAFFILLIIPGMVFSQLSHGGTPLTFSQDYLNLFSANNERTVNGTALQYKITTHNLPFLDNNKIQEEADNKIKAECSTCGKSYVSKILPIGIDFKSDASVQYLEDGSKIYLMKIASATA